MVESDAGLEDTGDTDRLQPDSKDLDRRDGLALYSLAQ